MSSIRRRLLVVLLTIMTLGWLIMAITGYLAAKREVEELFDAQLAQSARVLHALVDLQLDEDNIYNRPGGRIQLDYDQPGHLYESRVAFRVLDRSNEVLLQSDSFPKIRTLTTIPGYSDITENSDRWRYFVIHDLKHSVTLEVAQHYQPRNELIADIARQSLLPFIFMLPVMTILIWVGITRGLRPLRTTANDISSRTPATLQAIDQRNVPQEILPLINSLNKLFERLKYAMESERRFTMDAAHELRTPLAAIKTQAQVALRATEGREQVQAVEHIISGVDRASHLVRQLLVLARVDPDASVQEYEKLDLTVLLREVADDIKTAADDKQISFHITAETQGALILGQHQLIDVLIRNLLDNAIRYTPPRGEVLCRVNVTNTHACLTVSDNGPGVSDKGLKRIFDRFHRGIGTGQNGSGLGLSIVKRIAELHDASIETRTRTKADPGFTIAVSFHLLPSVSKG